MKTPITVRIEVDLLARTRRCAREENRTLTNFIETVLRQKVTGPVPFPDADGNQGAGCMKDETAHDA